MSLPPFFLLPLHYPLRLLLLLHSSLILRFCPSSGLFPLSCILFTSPFPPRVDLHPTSSPFIPPDRLGQTPSTNLSSFVFQYPNHLPVPISPSPVVVLLALTVGPRRSTALSSGVATASSKFSAFSPPVPFLVESYRDNPFLSSARWINKVNPALPAAASFISLTGEVLPS
ncbi:hypothetical protein BJX96DRAFT_133819 [Aspergillus floccosus]